MLAPVTSVGQGQVGSLVPLTSQKQGCAARGVGSGQIRGQGRFGAWGTEEGGALTAVGTEVCGDLGKSARSPQPRWGRDRGRVSPTPRAWFPHWARGTRESSSQNGRVLALAPGSCPRPSNRPRSAQAPHLVGAGPCPSRGNWPCPQGPSGPARGQAKEPGPSPHAHPEEASVLLATGSPALRSHSCLCRGSGESCLRPPSCLPAAPRP